MNNQQQAAVAFFQLGKVDEVKRLVFGRAVQSTPDKAGEVFDYAASKPHFEKWSGEQMAASGGKSAGNIRSMHKTDSSAGIVVPGGLTFHDDEQAIDLCVKVVDDQDWAKVMAGAYTGFSIGGRYGKSWQDGNLKRYEALPSEISLVDRPCVPTATFFDVQKADGTLAKVEFQKAVDLTPTSGNSNAAPDNAPKDAKAGTLFKDAQGNEYEFNGTQWVKKGAADAGLLKGFPADPKKGDKHTQDGKDYEHDGEGWKECASKLAKARARFGGLGVGALRKLALATEGATEEEVDALSADDLLVKVYDAAVAAEDKLEKGVVDVPGTEDEVNELLLVLKTAGKPFGEAVRIVKAVLGEKPELLGGAYGSFVRKVTARAGVNPQEGTKQYGAVEFADAKNHKYPLDNEEHVRAALSYWGMAKNKAKYSSADQATITARIEAAAKRMGIGKVEKLDDLVVARSLELAKAAGHADTSTMTEVEAQAFAVQALRELLRKNFVSCGDFSYQLNALANLQQRLEYEAMVEEDASPLPAALKAWVATGADLLAKMVAETVKETKDGTEFLQMTEALGALQKRAGPPPAPSYSPGGEPLQKLQADHAALQKSYTDLTATVVPLAARLAKLEAQPAGGVRLRAIGKGQDLSLSGEEPGEVAPIVNRDGTVDEPATAIKKLLATGGVPLHKRAQ